MSENYERSAHVLKVKWKLRKFELEGPILQKHFLLRYVRSTQNILFYDFTSKLDKINLSLKQGRLFKCQHINLFLSGQMKIFRETLPYFPDMLGIPIQRLSWHQMLHS